VEENAFAPLGDGRGSMIDTLPQQKTLPHSEESERAVLGGILLDPAVLPVIAGRLRPDDFYLDRHRVLYEAMLALQDARTAIDLRTLQAKLEQQLKFDEVGGLAYLAGLDLDLPDIGRIEAYVEIVKERSVRRRLIQASGQIIRDCLDGGVDAQEALGRAEQTILGLGEEAVQRGFVPLANVFHETLEELEERPGSLLTGVPTGFIDFDRISHGLNRGNLIIVAGRPGMGKTSFALNIAQHVAIRERRAVGIFSLEMGQQELALRILCSEADISFSRLRAGRVSQKEWTRIIQTVRANSDSPLFIDDSANPSLLEVASKSRRLKAEKGLALLVLDYLQLMQAGGKYENRNLEIAAISRGLKQLAKELDIPVIALSQLSRQPERRGSDHRPQLADLRESGCLAAGTRVTIASTGARVPIAELAGRQGFPVWALDPETLKLRQALVSRVFATGHKPVFRLTTRSGRTLRATANHKFLTAEGWRRLDRLAPGVHLAGSDISWDQVSAIEADGSDEVFDLTVPGAHNFVAEDVIVHNSIEQDADLVAFIYRDEVYNPSDENKGLAELIIAKHRNGETGTIELVFLGDTTSFRNLDRHGGPPAAPF
jgi:replicative DNA helicase